MWWSPGQSKAGSLSASRYAHHVEHRLPYIQGSSSHLIFVVVGDECGNGIDQLKGQQLARPAKNNSANFQRHRVPFLANHETDRLTTELLDLAVAMVRYDGHKYRLLKKNSRGLASLPPEDSGLSRAGDSSTCSLFGGVARSTYFSRPMQVSR